MKSSYVVGVVLMAVLGCTTVRRNGGNPGGGGSQTTGNGGGATHTGGSGGATAVQEPCVRGTTERCTGTDGCQGARVCRPDGLGFFPCDCGDQGAGGSASGGTGNAVAGNGGSVSGGGAGTGGSAGASVGGAGGAAGSAGDGAGGEASMRLAQCTWGCTGIADCVAAVGPSYADNYECVEGACIYLGCIDDADCVAQVGSGVCRPYPAWGYDVCTTACTVASDCFNATVPALGEHFECIDGGCSYTGCASDQECTGYFGPDVPAICGSSNGDVPYCNIRCETPEDCSSGLTPFDSDNYECQNHLCVYLGCLDDTECASYSASAPLCR